MKREEALKVLGDGKWATVTFTKADGTVRTMNCRTGVKKHLRGGEKAYDDEEKNIVTVYENGNDYKAIRCDRIISIKAHGEVRS